VIAQRTLQIAVDRWVAQGGVEARGGCSLSPSPGRSDAWVTVLVFGLVGVLRRRRASRLAVASR
jgi:MYXO-CTERM domain-containing protein